MADGFLGRWSQRKQAVREGAPLQEPPAPEHRSAQPLDPVPPAVVSPPQEASEPPPALTLEDAQKLSPESDFSPFVARGVAPEVRNAAMKKLFADPQFNVMDRLDIYIDDYSLPDPLPLSMLRQMASAQFLNLVDNPEKAAVATSHNDPELPGDPGDATGGAVASDVDSATPVPSTDSTNDPATGPHNNP